MRLMKKPKSRHFPKTANPTNETFCINFMRLVKKSPKNPPPIVPIPPAPHSRCRKEGGPEKLHSSEIIQLLPTI